jgi:hypothetical protein
MIFTDDDLKRLRDWTDEKPITRLAPSFVEALIARLEAAERCANFAHIFWAHCHDDPKVRNITTGEEIFKKLASAIIEWRKAAGK